MNDEPDAGDESDSPHDLAQAYNVHFELRLIQPYKHLVHGDCHESQRGKADRDFDLAVIREEKSNERGEAEKENRRHKPEAQKILKKFLFIKFLFAHHLGRHRRQAKIRHDADKLQKRNGGYVPPELFSAQVARHHAQGNKT